LKQAAKFSIDAVRSGVMNLSIEPLTLRKSLQNYYTMIELLEGSDLATDDEIRDMVKRIANKPSHMLIVKLSPKMHTTGVRLISVLEFLSSAKVAVIESFAQSLN